MSNRSHQNAGHRAMNRLRREGQAHSSELDRPTLLGATEHRVIIDDVVNALSRLPAGFAQLAIVDPPYNLKMAEWDSPDGYVTWAAKWLAALERTLAPHGSLVLFGGLQYQGEQGGDLLDIMHHLRGQASLRLVNLIIWNYPNGMSAHRFFANRHEEIAWYAKGAKYVFNLDEVREPFDPDTLRRYLRDPRLRSENVRKGRNPTNVWRIGRLNGNSRERVGHPTQKPRELIARLIRALSHPGHWVIDPFAGSGVTTRMAIELGRHSVAIDNDPSLNDFLDRQMLDSPAGAPEHRLEWINASTATSNNDRKEDRGAEEYSPDPLP